jgi:hypothetical protein
MFATFDDGAGEEVEALDAGRGARGGLERDRAARIGGGERRLRRDRALDVERLADVRQAGDVGLAGLVVAAGGDRVDDRPVGDLRGHRVTGAGERHWGRRGTGRGGQHPGEHGGANRGEKPHTDKHARNWRDRDIPGPLINP